MSTPTYAWLWRPAEPVPYGDAFELMHRLADRRIRAEIPDTLLLLEHPPVYTAGRRSDPTHILWAEHQINAAGAELHFVDRGGSVTFHGPGQLVGYPILDLSPDRRDVARYLRDLEEVLIRTLARYGLRASRIAGLTGVWAGDRKIASIGVHLSRWVTTHGFALNVSTDLEPFSWIVPCGLSARAITSMERLIGRGVSLEEVAAALVDEFAVVFGREMVPPDRGAAAGRRPAAGDGRPSIREAS